MREREIRRRCKRELRALQIRPPLDVRLLCRRLGERRGKPIRLVSYPIPVPGPFGLWLSTRSADYILYQQETSRSHQEHIILHEVGHVLADHPSDETDDSVWRDLLGNIPPDAIRRALRRSSYDETHEREAELVATVILEWASVVDQVTPQRPSDTGLQRIQDALGDRRGWL